MTSYARFACVVGAPRCGTTSLAGFLQNHPEVDFSVVKEPHYFSRRDLAGYSSEALAATVEAEYLARFFPDRSDARPLLAEGSVSYLYAPERMKAILRLWPDARFVIAVRDPLEMLPSLHQRLLCTGDESVADFEEAWSLMPARAEGLHVPRSCIDARMLQYREIGKVGRYVQRFFSAVGRNRCLVVPFDDLTTDPAGAYQRLVEFLELTPQLAPDLAPRRAAAGFKYGWLQRLLKRPPVATRMVLAGEKFRHRIKPLNRKKGPDSPAVKAVFAARRALLEWNAAPAPRVQMSEALRREICATFADDVALLSRLIGRDLSHWLDGTVPPFVTPEVHPLQPVEAWATAAAE